MGAFAAGELAEPVIPAAHLLTPLLIGLILAVAGLIAHHVPAGLNSACQAALGVLMGSYLNPASLHQAAGAVLPLVLVTGATILLSLGAAAVLARMGHIDRASATLGMVAGGSAAVVSTARDLDADSRVVAFLQYLRVVLVAATAPILVNWLLTSHAGAMGALPDTDGELGPVVTNAHQIVGLVLLAAVAVAGVLAGRAVRLPSPALLGPMLLTAALTVSGTLGGFAPTGSLRTVLFTIVGLDIGLRFTRSSLARVGRLLPLAAGCTVAISVACGALAWLLSTVERIPFADAYLATTPGGINAVLATAVATHADVSLISSVQSLRLFAMVLMAPLVIRLSGLALLHSHRSRW
ncbi:AbrB family transcriptional regulator [Sphaerisporangium album]|uniref:AbrB family transcriptional regulator n=1 Tax=Sphaerisporangium album TaxID=509200 RepID=A0A367FIU9_9ACTN|nr:AbrB family transcriptional regulator [Sphaerisporangium album]